MSPSEMISKIKINKLQDVCNANDFHLLDTSPVIFDNVGFVGNIR